MQVISSVPSMQRLVSSIRRDGRRIGLVPTMGCLHEGHLSLVRRARALADFTVVSIFVNPTQFVPGEDLDRYPRDLERDVELCRGESADAVFTPAAAALYAPGCSVAVEETELSLGLCGASRPGHFRGVTTVVAILFNIVRPDVAVFGQKDAQQAAVIRRMVRDLHFPVEIDVAPIVREVDGLAMSSRNAYLSTEDRARACVLYRSLMVAARLYEDGERDSAVIEAAVRAVLATADSVEYVAVVDDVSLTPVTVMERPALVAVAARVGSTRLIDNIVLGRDADCGGSVAG